MTIGSIIVLSGFVYASACRLANDVSELGITRGRRMALFCLLIGICVEYVFGNIL